jgi:hypothetical protein
MLGAALARGADRGLSDCRRMGSFSFRRRDGKRTIASADRGARASARQAHGLPGVVSRTQVAYTSRHETMVLATG